MNFYGTGAPLSQHSLDEANRITNVGLVELWALMSVETSGCGYLSDRRPKILYERHYFSRLTDRKYDAIAPAISAPTAGGYGEAGAHQYERLQAAMQLDSSAALRSTSWGLGQIMGDNYEKAGFASVEDMVAAMVAREDNQMQALASFLHSTGVDESLRGHRWADFARQYNGPSYAANNYDSQLDHFFEIYSSGPLPSLQIRAVQILLNYAGYDVGRVDGIVGQRTQAAISHYQSANELPVTGNIDDALIAKLGL
jgi:hypothetical protein